MAPSVARSAIRITAGALAETDARAQPADGLGPVPDRRRPGALLDRRREERDRRRAEAAVGEAAGAAAACAAQSAANGSTPCVLADARAPAAGRVLEHARVVEGALARDEVRILPDRAELGARPCPSARRWSDRRRRRCAASPATSTTRSCGRAGRRRPSPSRSGCAGGRCPAPPRCPDPSSPTPRSAGSAVPRTGPISPPIGVPVAYARSTKFAVAARDVVERAARRSGRSAACRSWRTSRGARSARRSRRASSPRPRRPRARPGSCAGCRAIALRPSRRSGPGAPAQPRSLDVAAGAVVRVGAADEAHAERVHAERAPRTRGRPRALSRTQVAARVRGRSAGRLAYGPSCWSVSAARTCRARRSCPTPAPARRSKRHSELPLI